MLIAHLDDCTIPTVYKDEVSTSYLAHSILEIISDKDIPFDLKVYRLFFDTQLLKVDVMFRIAHNTLYIWNMDTDEIMLYVMDDGNYNIVESKI